MTTHTAFRLMAISLLMLATAGCASLSGIKEPPDIRLANIRLRNITLLEQEFALTLRIQNPNQRTLSIQGLNFQVDVNDQEFLRGISNQKVSIPGYSEETMEVSGTSTLAGVFRQFTKLTAGQDVAYRLKGKVRVNHMLTPIPFDYSGQVPMLPQFNQ